MSQSEWNEKEASFFQAVVMTDSALDAGASAPCIENVMYGIVSNSELQLAKVLRNARAWPVQETVGNATLTMTQRE